MELDFLPTPATYFQGLQPDDPLSADLLVLCRDIADTTPPTKYPKVHRLRDSLRELFYVRYYGRNHSIRLYFLAKSDILLLVHIDPNKRRTKLSAGDKKQLENALAAGKDHIAEKERQRREAERAAQSGKSQKKTKNRKRRSKR